MNQIRKRLTYANVISTLCLFMLLGGGAYAATQLPKNSVGSKQLKKGSVNSAKVKDGSLKVSDLKPGVIPAPVDAYTKGESDGRYYTKTESNARFLGNTVTVVKTIAASLAANSFTGGSVLCPSGYQAIGGGVDPNGVFFGKVASSAPVIDGKRVLGNADGQHGAATGWEAYVTTEGAGTGTSTIKVAVICAPIG